jgi:glycosyltransferase involved in cell wall biosynthesis
MKVLIITYDYYPDQSPNTYRWKNVLESWIEKGVEIFVITAQKDNLPQFEKVNGVNIYRTGGSWIEKVKSKILHKDSAYNMLKSGTDFTIDKESLLRKIYNNTWKQIYFPDFAFLWRYPSQKLAQNLIENENITNLITVSWPFTDHVIGYNLKKKYKINWIADTIDPFYLSDAVNNKTLYHSLKYKLEKKILYSADRITVLTEKLKDKYLSLFPLAANKITVNHNIFVPYEIEISKVFDKRNTIKLVFVGTLAPITRSPIVALKLFSALLKHNLDYVLELHFYGNTIQCNSLFSQYSYLINKKIFIHGMTPRKDIPKILSEANVLLNIGNTNEYQEPSKLIEYIYLGKPILNVCSIINDSSKELLENYPLSLSIHEYEIYNSQILDKILAFLMNKETLKRNSINKIIENYLLQEVEKRYFVLLK